MNHVTVPAHSCTLHIHNNPDSGLRAIIAIHNTRLGPALGGCRCLEYPDFRSATIDATRLAKGMSYKAALAGIKHGGGKSVLIRPKHIKDRHAYFEEFGAFVESLDGEYITSVDSGTNTSDMDDIAHNTTHVCGTSKDGCTPSFYTAMGVLEGIKAAVHAKLNRRDLEGVHIAIQGVGNVGAALARSLDKLGAKLSISDVSNTNLQACLEGLSSSQMANIVTPDNIYDIECDVFTPCGLGGTITPTTLDRLQCKIIAGSANNQLSEKRVGQLLHDKGILYAPDYVINAGGLIDVSLIPQGQSIQEVEIKTKRISNTLEQIFERSKNENRACHVIADEVAENILYH